MNAQKIEHNSLQAVLKNYNFFCSTCSYRIYKDAARAQRDQNQNFRVEIWCVRRAACNCAARELIEARAAVAKR